MRTLPRWRMGGQLQSPMKAELCGAIVALGGGTPMRLASDNSAVVRFIKVMMHAKVKGRPFPFHRRPNEDLWAVLWEVIAMCQYTAIVANWTKGHATQSHVDEGVTTEWEAKQNEKADGLAEKGGLKPKPCAESGGGALWEGCGVL